MAAQDEDEDVGDSWEDIEEEDLIRRLATRQKEIIKQSSPKQVTPINNERTFIDGPMKIKYSEGGSEYVAPIKILKRPENEIETSSAPVASERTKKSLAEREAEYASARARILGDTSIVNKSSSKSSSSSSDKKLLQRNSSTTSK